MDETTEKLFNGELCIGCAQYEEETCTSEGHAVYCTACQKIADEKEVA